MHLLVIPSVQMCLETRNTTANPRGTYKSNICVLDHEAKHQMGCVAGGNTLQSENESINSSLQQYFP